ncbi:MAG: putative 4-hydroxybenzoate polyprenyltransferase [Rikenellaceae bacterium]|jgi:4-hydroxybenzoate polyprenyltransferase|nr:putative 4-hydroxybenzoate polyprenyltransferase [Rikenellaceae bacterium]
MSKISDYARLVKFSHTIFAMPFALVGYVYALVHTGAPFDIWLLVKILLCMVFARNAAMGFNRWADRKIDAENPRTAGREIPQGVVSPRAALWFVVVNATLFVATTAFINRLALVLSPVALFLLLGYSLAKRFTAWVHVILGVCLSIAPVGAYIAVTGSVALAPVVLAALVMTWVAGFDIVYALQDVEFDRTHGIHSIPARLPGWKGLSVSILLHLVTVYAVVVFGLFTGLGTLYWIGAGLFVALLVVQHILVTPTRTRNMGLAFDTVNSIASIVYALFTIIDLIA